MLIPFFVASIISAGLVKLGALSVWVTVLALVVQGLLIVISIGVACYLWQRFRAA